MYRYYSNKRVKVEGHFMLNGTHYSNIRLNGDALVVKTSGLSETKSKVTTSGNGEIEATVSRIEKDGSEVSSKVNVTTNEIKLKSGKVVLEDADSGAKLVVPESSDEIVIKTHNVIAKNRSGKKIDLGSIGKLDESKEVKKLKLDPSAIARCLEGEQKQHKGYTFTKVGA